MLKLVSMQLSNFRSKHFELWSVFLAVYSILILRSANSLGRFPADPGYDYIYDANINGIQSWISLDPYVHFGARFLSWSAGLVALENQAVALSLLVHGVWSATAVGIFFVLRHEKVNSWTCYGSALAVALCPAASESTLANVGNVKWALMALALVISSSGAIIRSPRSSALFLFVSGLTNPLLPIVLIPIALQFLNQRNSERKLALIPILGVVTSAIVQVFALGSTTLGRGHSEKVLQPWPGMGLFWWFGIASPVLICLAYITVYKKFRFESKSLVFFRISISVLLLVVVSYVYGGIADRYFVVPMILSWIIVFDFCIESRNRIMAPLRFVVVLPLLTSFGITAIKWFDSSWYLVGGPSWSSEISKAKRSCELGEDHVVINVGMGNTTDLACADIVDNS